MFCIRLGGIGSIGSISSSTTLLLAATCLLMTADVSTEKIVTCESGVHHLSCDSGVIIVEGALYGRADRQTCSEDTPPQQLTDTDCSQQGTVDVLKQRCDGKRECELNANVVQKSDPCPGINKYLETNHTCLPAIRLVICEHDSGVLFCDGGQVILVYGADYGRRDLTTCSYRLPAPLTRNVDCSNPTSKIAESCNGKSRCDVRVSNSVFGDPCAGTYKYLEVAYACIYSY